MVVVVVVVRRFSLHLLKLFIARVLFETRRKTERRIWDPLHPPAKVVNLKMFPPSSVRLPSKKKIII